MPQSNSVIISKDHWHLDLRNTNWISVFGWSDTSTRDVARLQKNVEKRHTSLEQSFFLLLNANCQSKSEAKYADTQTFLVILDVSFSPLRVHFG